MGGRLSFHLMVMVLFISFTISCTKKEAEQFGGTLRLGIYHKPTEINPLTTDSSISANLLELVFNALVHFKEDGSIEPELAEKWEISQDHLVWTFYLKRNVSFHDGTPLDAHDIKFTYDTIMKMKRSGNSHAFIYINKIEVLDPYTLQINLSKPDNLLWDSLSQIFIAPRHLLERKTDFSEYNRHPIGTGPYRFVKQDDEEVVLEANEKYFGGRPYLDQIIVKVLPSQQASLSHLIAGKTDMAFLINPEDYGALSQISAIRIYNNWYPILQILTLNLKNELFSNPEIRMALNYAVNREVFIERILKGKGTVASGTIFPGSGNADLDMTPYPYRPDLALQLLQKKGWQDRNGDFILDKGGKKFEFTALVYKGEELYSKILQIIEEQLRLLGIKMKIELIPFDDYVDSVFRKRNFESNLIHLVFRPSYDNDFSFWHSSQIEDGLNFSHYSNPKADALLEEARLSLDPEKRRKALMEFQQLLHDDPPGIFLFWREMPIAIHKRFRGVPEKRMESLRDLVNVWVPRGEQY
jgi:peptide/nickel transport system substrate-binding protein